MTEAEPCTSCGTTGGYQPPDSTRPKRLNGLPFGVRGLICHTCRQRLARILNRSPRLCDLCGQPSEGKTHEGAEFSLEGRICGECHEDLATERAMQRFEMLRGQAVKHTSGGHIGISERARIKRHRPNLDKLSPKDACDVIRREFRKLGRSA